MSSSFWQAQNQLKEKYTIKLADSRALKGTYKRKASFLLCCSYMVPLFVFENKFDQQKVALKEEKGTSPKKARLWTFERYVLLSLVI